MLDKPFDSGGSGVGLGCSSSGTIVACSYQTATGDEDKYVRVFDAATYTEYNDLNNPFFVTSFTSAPIVLDSGGVIAVDSKYVGYRPPGDNQSWVYVRKKTIEADLTHVNDDGLPVSPVLVGSKIIFIVEKCPAGTIPASGPSCGISSYKIAQDGGGNYTVSSVKAFTRLKIGSVYYETLKYPHR